MIWVRIHFDCAHTLADMGRPETHGHSYEARVWFDSTASVEMWRRACEPARKRLDHANLNDFITEPTMENIGAWLLEEVPQAVKVEIERRDCGCEVVRARDLS